MSIYTLSNLRDFAELVAAKVQDKIGDVETTVVEVSKNNAVLTGVNIRPKDACVSPTIYINDCYDSYRNRNKTVMDVINYVVDAYEKYGRFEFDIEKINSLEYVEPRIYPRLVKGEPNPLLKGKIYTSFMDMAVIYVVEVGDIGGFITITEELLKVWGITKSYLHELALSNLRKRPMLFMREAEYSAPMIRERAEEEGLPEEVIEDIISDYMETVPLWIVSNREMSYGAVYLISDEFKAVVEALGGDVYIIPSSVHELLVVPASGDAGALASMVPEVNATAVIPEEVLSNTLYRYSIRDGLRVA